MAALRRKKINFVPAVFCFVVLAIGAVGLFWALDYFGYIPKKYYTNEDFGIERVKSSNDANGNGIDDYTDILLGARVDAQNKPMYKSAYYAGGYPPDNEGVCTDLVWRAFKHAGYSLKDMVDKDIAENVVLYPRVEGRPDKNIDFRRVKNLKVFFDRHAVSLTLDPLEIDQWQPGDIVIFGRAYTHIGIISDKRNKDGIPYLIHNAGQPNREEDVLLRYAELDTVAGHYRFVGKKENID